MYIQTSNTSDYAAHLHYRTWGGMASGGGGGGGGGGEVWGGGSMPQQGLASHIKHLTQNAKCGTPMLTLTISSNENGGFFWV